MAVLIDAVSTGGADFSGSASASITIGNQTNRAVFVGVAAGVIGATTITGVTGNGVAMTLAGSSNRELIYVMVNPPVGNLNIVATSSVNTSINIQAVSCYQVDQATPVEATNSTANQFATSVTTAVTLSAGGLIFGIMGIETGATVTEVAGQTVIAKNQNNNGGLTASAAYKSGSGSTSLGWTWDGSPYKMVHVVVAVKPDAVPADSIAPSFNGTITAGTITTTSAIIDWSATTRSDNVAITGFETSINGGTSWVAAGNGTSATVSGYSPNTTTATLVRAMDAAGNKSTPPLSVNVTTPAVADTTPPIMNGAITQGAVTSSSIAGTYPAASDNVGVTGYEISKDGGSTYVANGTSLAFSFTGLAAATAFPVRVRALDSAGNRANTPLALTITTAAAAQATVPILSGLRKSIQNGGLPRSGTFKLYVRNMTTKADIANQPGLAVTNGSTGAAFQLAGLVTGTEYDAQIVNEADATDYGFFRFVAA